MTHTITILGSTGSIGRQTLSVAEELGLRVAALTAEKNVDLLEAQCRKYRPELAVMTENAAAEELKTRLADMNIRVLAGSEALCEAAALPQADTVVAAVCGFAALRPTLTAIREKKRIALANKETLVTAGHIIMPLAAEKKVPILPVDSEHSAIFQSMNGENRKRVSKILLTASGGPFRGKKREELADITVEDALKHPNWSMGRKITVDSSTLVNKGLEVIEAKWLFNVEPENIQVVVQPQSVIHSMVEYEDGGIMAQLGTPDMKLPIQYALFYPDRRPLPGKRLDYYEMKSITFEKPDTDTFLGLPLAYRAIHAGGSMPTVFNAANEKAVALFLDKKIRFLTIYDLIQGAMENHKVVENPSVEQILEAEAEAHAFVESHRRS